MIDAKDKRPQKTAKNNTHKAEIIVKIADEVGAYLMVDMAHIAGLVAAGLHPSPVPYADFVTTTTHKTLRGPRGGLILCKEKYAQMINKAVFPGNQGGPLMHIIAAKAVCFKEALSPEFKEYQLQVKKNAAALCDELLNQGIDIISGGTDNHLMLVDLSKRGLTGKEIEHNLDEIGITANKNTIPNDPQSPFVTSGLRLGAPAVTTRGFKEEDMLYMSQAERDFSVRFSPFVNERNIFGIMEELSETQRHIEQNVNAKMVFFDMSLRMIVWIKNR